MLLDKTTRREMKEWLYARYGERVWWLLRPYPGATNGDTLFDDACYVLTAFLFGAGIGAISGEVQGALALGMWCGSAFAALMAAVRAFGWFAERALNR